MLLSVPVALELAGGVLFPPRRVPSRWSRTIPGKYLGVPAEFTGLLGIVRPLVLSRLSTSSLFQCHVSFVKPLVR